MTVGYSRYTLSESVEEVRKMRKASKELRKNPEEVRRLLIAAGILSKSGKSLAKKYKS